MPGRRAWNCLPVVQEFIRLYLPSVFGRG